MSGMIRQAAPLLKTEGGSFAYNYDGLKRLSSRNLCVNDSTFLTREYSYLAGAGTDGTTTLVSGPRNDRRVPTACG